MAAFALTDTSIYVGALDQSCFSDTVGLERTGDTLDATTFCSAGWRVMVPGLSSWSASFGGPQDLAASSASTTYTPDEHYAITVGTAYPLTMVPQGAAEGSIAYGSYALLQQYTPLTGSVGDLAKHNVMAVPYLNAPLVRGVLASKSTLTASAVGTGHQLGAVTSAQRVYANIHVLTRGGTGTLTAYLDSDDNGSFTSATTQATSSTFSARGSEQLVVAGAITDTYWRMAFVVGGGSPSFQVRCFIGIQ